MDFCMFFQFFLPKEVTVEFSCGKSVGVEFSIKKLLIFIFYKKRYKSSWHLFKNN